MGSQNSLPKIAAECDAFLQPFQAAAIDRFTRRCRNQHGGLLIHSMGSGKTRTAMSMAMNYPYNKRKIIVTPPALSTPWVEEAEKFGITAVDIARYNVRFMDYTDLSRLMLADTRVFADSLVLCDEAHWLLKIVGKNPNVVNALNSASKVYLLTGTPVQNNFNDLCILVNLAAGKRLMPGTIEGFNHDYRKGGGLFLKAKTLNASSYAPWAGLVAGAIKGGPLSSYPIMSGLGAGYAAGYVADLALSGLLAILDMLNDPKPPILVTKLFADIKNYVSYFDYENLTGKAAQPFPIKRFRTGAPLHVPMTDFQTELLTLFAFQFMAEQFLPSSGLRVDIPTMFRLSGQAQANDTSGASEKLYSDQEFKAEMRRIGNMSEDNLFWGTVREDARTLSSMHGPEYAAEFGLPYKAVYAGDRAKLGEIVHEDVKFNCPKFDAAYRAIDSLRRQYTFLPLVYSNFDEIGFQTFSAFLTSINRDHIVVHADDSQEVRLGLVERSNEPYKRLGKRVDPSTGKEKDFFMSDDDMLDETLAALLAEASKNGRKDIEEYREKLRRKKTQEKVPYCVLLHPSIREGYSFTMAPAMIVLEVPIGYGNQEQIYARVLRTTNPFQRHLLGINNLVDPTSGRVVKEIFQLFTGAGTSTLSLSGLHAAVPTVFPRKVRFKWVKFLTGAFQYSGAVVTESDLMFGRKKDIKMKELPLSWGPHLFPGIFDAKKTALLEYWNSDTSEELRATKQRARDKLQQISMDERTMDDNEEQLYALLELNRYLSAVSDADVDCVMGTETNYPCTNIKCGSALGTCHEIGEERGAARGGAGAAEPDEVLHVPEQMGVRAKPIAGRKPGSSTNKPVLRHSTQLRSGEVEVGTGSAEPERAFDKRTSKRYRGADTGGHITDMSDDSPPLAFGGGKRRTRSPAKRSRSKDRKKSKSRKRLTSRRARAKSPRSSRKH